MKVINDLLGYQNRKIVQDTDWFRFSLDSVLLANFVTVEKNILRILDIGTGNLPIPLILSTKTAAKIFGFEIQQEIYDLAAETLKLNRLEEQIQVICDDVNHIQNYFQPEFFDLIVTNPPYFKFKATSIANQQHVKTIARHEVFLTLQQTIEISSKYLKNNGKFALVHRTDRLVEILETMKKYRIEPKRIQFVYSKVDSNSNMVLIEGVKNGKSGIKCLAPLIVHHQDGSYSLQVKKFFQ